MKVCKNCGFSISNRNIFCNNKCQLDYQNKKNIREWIEGQKKFTRKGGTSVPSWMRRYLLEEVGYKCSECGWSEENPYTKTIPLDVDHIDGDAYNNSKDNLRVLCPNCHSLKMTYKNTGRRNSTRKLRNKPL
jgi:5-methylcytosine-specific restriction endonuclease McrA